MKVMGMDNITALVSAFVRAYHYGEMEASLAKAGFLIYEHMNAAEATEAFFREYNQKNAEHMMTAPEGVVYCFAVKK